MSQCELSRTRHSTMNNAGNALKGSHLLQKNNLCHEKSRWKRVARQRTRNPHLSPTNPFPDSHTRTRLDPIVRDVSAPGPSASSAVPSSAGAVPVLQSSTIHAKAWELMTSCLSLSAFQRELGFSARKRRYRTNKREAFEVSLTQSGLSSSHQA